MRISDWSSDVCSSDLLERIADALERADGHAAGEGSDAELVGEAGDCGDAHRANRNEAGADSDSEVAQRTKSTCQLVDRRVGASSGRGRAGQVNVREHAEAGAAVVELSVHHRSVEHTYELQSLMSISYAVFCLNNNLKLEPLN